ncbi:MAG: ISNCY family transposase, partial [Candidatus Rokubacteria bacterium]|nr:ISNCY family transposase [Candidatus Rokubacteria bacterium]
MREQITLNRKEQTRGKVLTIVLEGRCTTEEAAGLLRVSERHLLRLKKGFREEGPAALAHGNRGRRPAHAIQEGLRQEVVQLATSVYAGYNHTHLQEELEEGHSIKLSRRSVSRILTAAGLRSPRQRRARKHRAHRPPMPRAGMMLQVDGSRHDWLEGRGPQLVLIGAVDDATGELVHALFGEQEDAAGYLTLLRETVRKRGVPLSWYSDRHSIFQRNGKEPWTLAEELAGRREPTQVARALEELGINLILAGSPQAKGRVERCWGTLQDRLGKELRQAGACTLEEANRVLKTYLPRFRKRFAHKPAEPQSAYRPLPPGTDLASVCSFHYFRRVANDNTVRLEERLVQIPPGPGGRSYAGCRVQLQERLDGSLAVVYQGRVLARQPASSQSPLRARQQRRDRSSATYIQPEKIAPPRQTPSARAKSKPPSTHPWRTLMWAA